MLRRSLALAAALLGAAALPAALAAQAAATPPAAAQPAAAAAAPVVTKVDPPDWWANHSLNPVRLMVHGSNLQGARLACGRMRCGAPKVSASGRYLWVDVTIPRGTAPGAYPLALTTAAGRASVPFAVDRALPRAGRYAGFDANDVIYQIMPDRFANGDTANDRVGDAALNGRGDAPGGARLYHGGDLRGIRQRLPYLKALGVTTLWINPIYENANRVNPRADYQGRATSDYHGYHAMDFYGVEDHFGTLAEFRTLVDEAHAQGLKVMLDMVANHVGPLHPWVDDPPTPTWFNGTPAQHQSNNWQIWTIADPWGTPALRAQTLGGWFAGTLPDLNQDDPEVSRYIIQNTLWWVAKSGMDAIRQDTWPYVPRSFWQPWMRAIRAEYPRLRVVGEVYDGDPTVVSFFQDGRRQFDGLTDQADALFDFPLHFTMRRAFGEGRALKEVVQMLGRDHLYPSPDMLSPFLDNHDVSRFMDEPGATTDGLKLGLTFLLTTRGVPLLYYGTEIAMPGSGDPDNRRDFPGGWPGDARSAFDARGRTAAEQDVWAHTQRLLQLRAANADLRTGRTTHLLVTDQQVVYRRGRTVVAINNDTARVELRVPASEASGLEARRDALGACAAPRREGAELVLAVPRRAGCIF
jgi:glycosidase